MGDALEELKLEIGTHKGFRLVAPKTISAAISEIERLRAAQVEVDFGGEIERLRVENKRLQEQAARLGTAELLAERDEADRRAGAAERRLEKLEEDARRRRQWLDNAKRSRGYPWTVSFDTVWAETCAKADASVGVAPERISPSKNDRSFVIRG